MFVRQSQNDAKVSSRYHPLRWSEEGSVDYSHYETTLPEILLPSHSENVLKKTNQRLLKNADNSKLK